MQVSTVKEKKGQKRMQTNQVVPKASAPIGSHTPMSEWGKAEVPSNMFLIPKVLVMQLTSELVKNNKALFGDFVSSMDEAKIGSCADPLEIVPIYMHFMWCEYDIVKNKKEFKQIVPLTPLNQNLPRKYKNADGSPGERDELAQLYCLLPKLIKEGKGSMPYVLSFRSTSMIAGRKISTQMYCYNPDMGRSPASRAFDIIGARKDGDKGSWIQLDSKPTRDASVAEEQEALKWFKIIIAGQTKVEHDEHSENSRQEKEVSDY